MPKSFTQFHTLCVALQCTRTSEEHNIYAFVHDSETHTFNIYHHRALAYKCNGRRGDDAERYVA